MPQAVILTWPEIFHLILFKKTVKKLTILKNKIQKKDSPRELLVCHLYLGMS